MTVINKLNIIGVDNIRPTWSDLEFTFLVNRDALNLLKNKYSRRCLKAMTAVDIQEANVAIWMNKRSRSTGSLV
jgi:hypothetical protein